MNPTAHLEPFLLPTPTHAVLDSEVTACQIRITALEADLAAAAAEHSSRLVQQQKAFLCKLEQLRQVHNQQVAAAIREAQVRQQSTAPGVPEVGQAALAPRTHLGCIEQCSSSTRSWHQQGSVPA